MRCLNGSQQAGPQKSLIIRQVYEMSEALPRNTKLAYRADIDGLRAVAVLSVIAFHIKIPAIPGGFIGVDVFFVISGYLISSIIFFEIAAGRFSVFKFYERRIRRIFPALFAMLAVVGAYAGIYLLPVELTHLSKSMLAAITSSSNFYFWQHSGYFDNPLSQPLLHTWSLAVEEQFYIFFPLFLVLVRTCFPRYLRISVFVLFFVSLLTSIVMVAHSQSTAFYMPYTRAWELLLGTILSLGVFPRLSATWKRNLCTVAGIGMIAQSAAFLTRSSPFPGANALPACLGSALIIGAGESGSSLVAAALSWGPVVFVGLISYSFYLWHWPVIVFQKMGVLLSTSDMLPRRLTALVSSGRLDALFEVAASFLLALLSWRFVERPFRSGRLRLGGPPLFALAGTVVLALAAISSCAILSGGFPGRFPAKSAEIAAYLDQTEDNNAMRVGTCFISSSSHFEDYRFSSCLREDTAKKNYLLLGDSHSAMVWSALQSSLPNINIMQAGSSGCNPFVSAPGSTDCRKMMNFIYGTYLPSHRIDGLILAAQWREKNLGSLAETLAWTEQHRIPVILLGPVPEYDAPLPRLLAYSIAWNKPALASQHRVVNDGLLDSVMERLARTRWHVLYISLYSAICDGQDCDEFADAARTIPLMSDSDHFTRFGSLEIIRRLVSQGKLR